MKTTEGDFRSREEATDDQGALLRRDEFKISNKGRIEHEANLQTFRNIRPAKRPERWHENAIP
jgi:hypothetical protein